MPTYNFLAFSGSLRKGSYNTALAKAFVQRAPEGVAVEFVDIHSVPLYDQDDEAAFPQLVTDLKDKIKAADGILIVTPEYNRSMPGVLKNFIDWTSRPYGDNAWKRKPVFVLSASIGPIAAALAQYDVKKVMTYLDAHVMGQPEFYCGTAQEKFDAAGVLTDEETKTYIDSALAAFTAFVDQVR